MCCMLLPKEGWGSPINRLREAERCHALILGTTTGTIKPVRIVLARAMILGHAVLSERKHDTEGCGSAVLGEGEIEA